MKYLSIILIVFWGSTEILQAQSGYYNQHQQYGKDTDFISYQRYIPEGFLFLVDDTFQQVLANPSKAYLIDSSYVSTTLQNNSGTNLRSAGVLNGKWFYAISSTNSFGTQENESDNEYEADEIGIGEFYDIRRFSGSRKAFNEQNNNDHSVQLRLINTWRTGEKTAKAFGVFLAVEWNESTLDRHDVFTRVDIRERFQVDTLLQLQTRNLREFSGRENNHRLNVFLAGIEYHSSNENRESSHYFHYQKNVFKRVEQITTQLTDTSRTFLPEDLTDPEYISGQNRNISNLLRLNTRPNLISYKVYQNVKLSWMENDFLFFGLSARYSWDGINFDSEQTEIRESFNIDNATEVIYKDVALSDKKDKDWLGSGTFSLGYAIEVNPDDRFMFFTGVNSYLSMYKSRGYFLDVTGVIKTERTAYNPGIRIPLYGSYSFTDWFNIWGGGSINYYYNREKNENQLVTPVEDQGIGYNFLTNKNSTDNSSFGANKNIFLGFKASHKSGISANVDVRNELLGRITNWFVTIGYSF